MSGHREVPGRDQETIEIAGCPDCGARKGQPCVYMPLRHAVGTEPWRAERVGQPTRFPHMGRRDRARLARARRDREAQTAAATGPLFPFSGPAAIAQAEREWDLAQRRELVAWLARYASILTEAGVSS